MGGIEIMFLLGLYFIVVSLSFDGGKLSADFVRLFFGVVFVICAVAGFNFI